MFKPISTKYTTVMLGAPDNWDTEKDGECIGLPVYRDETCYYSWWSIGWKDRLKILFGKPIRLTIFSFEHPPVSIDAE